jgi:type I restriction enzyme S subunit
MREKNRTYFPEETIVFQKNNEPYGEFSNMAKFPLTVNGVNIRTTEALYQACKYPYNPEAQQAIIDQKSPMAAKYKSRAFNTYIRSDWEAVKVNVMRWCLRIKLAYYPNTFGKMLLSTDDKVLVERSNVDAFWGAKPQHNGTLIGQNVLGRLLMELRAWLREADIESTHVVPAPNISHFLLLDSPIETMSISPVSIEAPPPIQPRLL